MIMSIKDNKNKIIESFNHAVEGIIKTVKTENHMKFHIIIAIGVIMLSLIFEVSKIELLILILTISSVFTAEIINTAIEKVVDLIEDDKWHPLAKFAKDAAAGAVLITAIASIFVAYIIFFEKILKLDFTNKYAIISHISILILSLLMIIIITVKSSKYNLSGHATISASLVGIISMLTDDKRIILISLILFVLVCQSRIKSRIHSLNEVILGSSIGFCITYLIFKMLIKLGYIL